MNCRHQPSPWIAPNLDAMNGGMQRAEHSDNCKYCQS